MTDRPYTRETLNDKNATAIHEAGHAVIGRVLDLACGGATIMPNEAEGEAGHAIFGDPYQSYGVWDDRYVTAAFNGKLPTIYRTLGMAYRARIITLMAGAEAEAVICGRRAVGDGDDRRQIEMMAASSDSEIPEDSWPHYEPRMRRQTRRLIRKHREQIERVASALVERETLTAEQIDELLA